MQINKAGGALGAVVTGIDLAAAQTGTELHAAIEAQLFEHQVLFFPGQAIDAPALQAFAAGFGELEDHPAYPTVPGTRVQMLESTAAAPSKIEAWHSDMTFRAAPPSYTLVHGKVIPAYGGDTLFASAVAAYAGLSAPLQALVDGLSACHDFAHGFRESLAEPGGAERLAPALAANPPVSHPVVRRHPRTGRRALYVNPLFTTRIEGLAQDESDALLALLCARSVDDDITVRLRWTPDTVVVWDNAQVLHKPVNDFHPQHRMLHRLTVRGEQPH